MLIYDVYIVADNDKIKASVEAATVNARPRCGPRKCQGTCIKFRERSCLLKTWVLPYASYGTVQDK